MSSNGKPIKVIGKGVGKKGEKPKRLEALPERPHMGTTMGMPTPRIQSPNGMAPKVVLKAVEDPRTTQRGFELLEGAQQENVFIDDDETKEAMKKEEFSEEEIIVPGMAQGRIKAIAGIITALLILAIFGFLLLKY